MATNPTAHPSAESLRALALGKLDVHTAARVMKHLDVCPECCREVTATTNDDFLNRLRQVHGRSSTPAPAKPSAAPPHTPQSAPVPTTLHNVPPELANYPQYEIVRELGRGGMGVVYLAKNKLMGRLEVLKVLNKALLNHPGAAERFLREIRSAAKLNHPNVVAAYSALQLGELLVFAMEYVEGEDLQAVVKARGPLPVVNACHYVQQAAIGLQHAFEKGMIHRDIKPQNLILAREGKKHIVKVLDFGLAKARFEKQEAERRLTRVGEIMGTPGFIAPEQAVDTASADIRADIYSLGCTLYYLLTGQPPHTGGSVTAILVAHRTEEPRPLNLFRSDLPTSLAVIVRKMMAKELSQRYQTPAEVVQALALAGKQAAQMTPPKPSPPVPAPAPPPMSHQSLLLAETILPSSATAPPSMPRRQAPPVIPPAIPSEAARADSSRGRSAPMRKTCLLGVCLAVFLLTGMMGLLAGAVWMWKAGLFEPAPSASAPVVEDNKPNVPSLPAKPEDGVLVIAVNEPNPDVTVDGEKMAATWSEDGKKTSLRVRPGRRRVEVRKASFRPVSKELLVTAGATEVFTAELLPDDAGMPPAPKPLPVVLYPAVDQKDVPLLFVPELPDPLPKGAEAAGYPVTVTFPKGTAVEDVRAVVEEKAGGALETWLSTPAKPALTKEQQGNAVCLIPKKPLQPQRTYAVSVEAKVDGAPWRRQWDFTTGAAAVGEATLAAAVLERLNHHRQAAGLKPAAANRVLSQGCVDHARYVARNAEYLATAGSLRDEEVGRACYTEAGRKAARQALVSGRRRHPRDVIDDWIAAPLLRPLLLAPVLDEVGVGTETEVRMGWATVLALSPPAWPPNSGPVLYPPDQQKNVPLAVYSLVPGDTHAAAGYPITITFRPSARVKDAKLELRNDLGEEVTAWFSNPETPAAEQLSQTNTICLLPKEHLRPAKTYSVAASASVNGMAWTRSWKFTTEGSADEAAVDRAVLARVNAHRAAAGLAPVVFDAGLSRGCGLHARYLVLNANEESAQGLGMHDEDRRLPGYSVEGERAGKRGVITTHFDPTDAVDAWVGSFFHRLPFLDARLKRIGLGYSKGGPNQGWVTVLDLE
jgi:serine/threonine protein kinase/uncharacterized protein YkwD